MSYDALIERAIKGIAEAQTKTDEELKQGFQTNLIFPPSIPIGAGKSLPITADGLSALRELGGIWYENDPALSAVLSKDAARDQAVFAFGDLLEARDRLNADTEIKKELARALEQRIRARTTTEHFYFTVRAFEQADVQTLNVGPVTFFRRAQWLDEMERIAGQPLHWKAAVLKAWGEGLGPEGVAKSDDIIRFVGTCDWVAAVSISGRDRSRSTECSRIAVVVALDALGLEMSASQANNFRGPGDSLNTRMDRRISQFDGRDFNAGTSVDLPRIGGPPGWQASYVKDTTELRKAVGAALTAFVEIAPIASAPEVLRRWIEAMYWFGQARREDDNFIALVKYGVALDVLARGGKARGITTLACALFAMQANSLVTADGVTLEQLIRKLYDEGRSKISHGGVLSLLQELAIEVTLADDFTRRTLIQYVVIAANYNDADTYAAFLAAIPTIHANLASKRGENSN